MKCKHKSIKSNLSNKETPGVLRSPVFCLSMHHFFLDTLFERIERLSLNIINNSSVQALCSKVSHPATSIILLSLLLNYDEFPRVKKC